MSMGFERARASTVDSLLVIDRAKLMVSVQNERSSADSLSGKGVHKINDKESVDYG